MSPKKIVLITSLLLTSIGLLFLSVASQNESIATTGNAYHFISKQLIWCLISIFTFLIGKKIKATYLQKYAKYIYFLSLVFLAIVLIPSIGNTALGARRWLDFGIIGIQPSEIAKVALLIFFASSFSLRNLGFKQFLLYLSLPLLLIILEPNLSTTVIITATILTLFYLANGDIFTISIIALMGIILSILLTIFTPYRQARLMTLINPDNNQESSYHSQQLIITIASGGFFGKGFSNSTQKYQYLPKVSTDSILAIIAEEIGFIGICGVIFLYYLLISSILKISQSTTNDFFANLISGIALLINFQTLTNIGAILGLIPLTGVPLPFISYGGSSLSMLFFLIGITQNQSSGDKLIYLKKSHDEKDYHHRQTPHPGHRVN